MDIEKMARGIPPIPLLLKHQYFSAMLPDRQHPFCLSWDNNIDIQYNEEERNHSRDVDIMQAGMKDPEEETSQGLAGRKREATKSYGKAHKTFRNKVLTIPLRPSIALLMAHSCTWMVALEYIGEAHKIWRKLRSTTSATKAPRDYERISLLRYKEYYELHTEARDNTALRRMLQNKEDDERIRNIWYDNPNWTHVHDIWATRTTAEGWSFPYGQLRDLCGRGL